jgi:hypothetical protein
MSGSKFISFMALVASFTQYIATFNTNKQCWFRFLKSLTRLYTPFVRTVLLLTFLLASFDCPICRTSVSVPYVNCSSEDWAKWLPLNSLVIGLTEKQKIERAETQCMSTEFEHVAISYL